MVTTETIAAGSFIINLKYPDHIHSLVFWVRSINCILSISASFLNDEILKLLVLLKWTFYHVGLLRSQMRTKALKYMAYIENKCQSKSAQILNLFSHFNANHFYPQVSCIVEIVWNMSVTLWRNINKIIMMYSILAGPNICKTANNDSSKFVVTFSTKNVELNKIEIKFPTMMDAVKVKCAHRFCQLIISSLWYTHIHNNMRRFVSNGIIFVANCNLVWEKSDELYRWNEGNQGKKHKNGIDIEL